MASLLPSSGTKKGANNDQAIQNANTRLTVSKPDQSLLAKSYANTGKQSLKDQALSSLSPLMNLAGTGLNIVERPSQAILHALNAFSGQKAGIFSPKTLENAGSGFIKGLTDIRGTDNYNLRRTMNQDPNVGGRLAGLFDTVGTAAIDPTSYLTGGTKAVGKAGLKVIESQLGKDVAESVTKRGIKSLDSSTQKAVETALRESPQAAATKGGAEKFTKNALSALEGGAGIKFAGKTALKYGTLAPVARAIKAPEVIDALKATKPVDLVRKGVLPMAKVTDLVGSKVAKDIEGVIRRGRAQGDNAAMDTLTQVRSAIKDSGQGLNDIKTGLTDVLNGAVPQGLDSKNTQLLSTLENVRNTGLQAKQEAVARGLGQEHLGISEPSQGLTRSLTKEAVKEISRNPTKIARALSLDASATPANIVKHLQQALPNESLQGANERLSSLLGIKNALETNPIKVLTDQTIKAHRDAATADTLKGLMDVMDEQGKPIISTVKRPGDIARETVLGTVYGPKEVLDELDHAAITLTDDHALKEFGNVLDKWGKLWRGYATVPVLFGLGFHERNFVGNVFNMWLLGFHNPTLFHTSDKILRAIESGTNKGLTADAAIDGASKLSPEERQWIRLARQEGVVSDSFFRIDQATNPTAGRSVKERAVETLNPVSTNNAVLRSGQYIGRRIEDNSRLAMFIDQMQKHGDPQIAAENVKKALFDYSELTPSEKALKRVVPFYTYMRKNTPLQVQAMLKNPGKFSTLAHAQDNAVAGASDTDGKPVPQYALANGAIPLIGGNTPILGSLQLPYQAAAQQIQPLLALASQAPGTPQSLRTEGGSGDALRQILSNFGGGPIDLAKLGVEQATGKSLYTGQDIKPGTGIQRTVKALIPLAGKGDSTITNLTSSDSGVRNAQLLAALSGLQTTALTNNRVEGEKARRASVLQALAKGTPTISELRKQGKAPAAKRIASKNTKKSTSGKHTKKVSGNLPKTSHPKPKKTS